MFPRSLILWGKEELRERRFKGRLKKKHYSDTYMTQASGATENNSELLVEG